MSSVKLDQQRKRLEIRAISTDNQLVFEYFSSLPETDRESALDKALYLGVLALQEDRLSAFLAKTKNELGTELESLKIRLDIDDRKFFGSSQKGVEAEIEIAAYLEEFCKRRKFDDGIALTGTTPGTIPKNKTGDICCTVDADRDVRIIVECKFDRNVALGGMDKQDIYANRSDTAWSQLIEASANRDGRISIIVFDRELANAALLAQVENVSFIPEIGFIVIVESRRSHYENLGIAYALARDICVRPTSGELNRDLLSLVVQRVLKDIEGALVVEKHVRTAAHALTGIMESTHKSRLSMEFSRSLLERLLDTGSLTTGDLLALYNGSEPKHKYQAIRDEIDELTQP